MKRTWTRIFTLLLAVIMLTSLLPASAVRMLEDELPAIPVGDEVTASPSAAEAPDGAVDAPARLLDADTLNKIPGYVPVTELPTGSHLDEGKYIFVAPYDGNYYMLYPGGVHAGNGAVVHNAAKLKVEGGVATGYYVRSGTANPYYNETAEKATDFSKADNYLTYNSTTGKYFGTATNPDGITYCLFPTDRPDGAAGALYQPATTSTITTTTSSFTITKQNNGYFKLQPEKGSTAVFWSAHMNFNQAGASATNPGDFLIFKRIELHFDGYTRVNELPEGGLDNGKYLFVAPHTENGEINYYMLYPGDVHTTKDNAPNVNNSAKLVLDSTGKAIEYKVRAGNTTRYEVDAVSSDFSRADNTITAKTFVPGGDYYYYAATALGPDDATYYLCEENTDDAAGALYQTTGPGTVSIHAVTNTSGIFNMRHGTNHNRSWLIFHTPNMNFNQNSSTNTTDAIGTFMIFKRDELTIEGYDRVYAMPEDGLAEDKYLIVAPYGDDYYMLYPGATGAGAGVNNSAKLVVADGKATGYQVGSGTSYAAATATNFRLAENQITKTDTTYSVVAGVDGGYKLVCGSGAEVYQPSTATSSLTVTGRPDGYFRFSGTDLLSFHSANMNFDQGSADTTHFPNLMLFRRSRVVPGTALSHMLNDNDSGWTGAGTTGQNSWVFTGGRAAQGSFADIAGARSYAGHFEEYIRYTQAKASWNVSDRDHGSLQRHVINAAYTDQTLKNIVDTFDTRIEAALDPRAVVYLVDPRDSTKTGFADDLRTLITKTLALRDGTGMLVIGTLTEDDRTAVDNLVANLADEVKPYVLPVHFDLIGTHKTADGFPNASGHYEMAKTLANAVAGRTVSSASSWPYSGGSNSTMATDFPTKQSLNQSHGYENPATLSAPQNAIQNKMKDANKDYMTWLFMGDSITHGAAWTGGFDTISQSFEKFLKDDLGRKADVVINSGSSGATTATTINDLTRRLTKYSPDVVVLMLGTNDSTTSGMTEDTYKANLRTLVDAILDKGAVPVLRTPPPTKSGYENLGSYAHWMKEMAAEEDYANKVILIDQYSHWADTTNWLSVFSRNDFHPNEVGQLWMTHQLIHQLALWKEDASICRLEYEAMAAPTPPTVPANATVVEDWTDLRPDNGTTQGQPFPGEGIAGGDFFRIPALVTLEHGAHKGRVVAMTDARWAHMGDGKNIDTLLSYSDDNGATWHYSFPNFFGDTVLNAKPKKAAIFIDPVLAQDKDGNLYLMADAFPAGCSNWQPYQSPEAGTGFAEIGGVQRLTVYPSPDNTQQDNNNYSHYVGDFASINGSATKYAPILNAEDGSESGFYTDDYFYLYYTATGTKNPAKDKIYCPQLDGSSENGNPTDTWVQQNLFFYNATLHVRSVQYLYLVKSTDGGETWSAPKLLNGQVRTGVDTFYGPGPGAGTYLADGTVILPCYISGGSAGEHSSFIYSKDGGETWKRTPSLTIGSSESTIVQIDDTTVRQFYRSGASTLRYVDYTKDADGLWTPTNTEVEVANAVRRSGNQLSSIRYSKTVDGKPLILVSTSTSANGGNAWSRWHGMIHAFTLEADKTMRLLHSYEVNDAEDWYGYSSITELSDGKLAVLYESGHTDVPSKYSTCSLQYTTLHLNTIFYGNDLAKDVRAAEATNTGAYTIESLAALQEAIAAAKTDLANGATASFADDRTALQAAIDGLEEVDDFSVTGTVKDENNAPISGVTVTLEGVTLADSSFSPYYPTGLTAVTDQDGKFTFESTDDVTLSALNYKLKVQAVGYQVDTKPITAFYAGNSDTTITLVPEQPATYVNDFDGGDITMLGGATDDSDSATATLTLVDDPDGGKAVKISGLGGNWYVPVHVLDYNAPQIKNGTVEMDITLLGTTSNRFGLALRANGAGNRVWIGHFEGNSTGWNWQSYRKNEDNNEFSGGNGSFGAGPLLMGNNVTRHVKVEMKERSMTLWVDGIRVGQVTGMDALNVAGYVGFSSLRSNAEFIIDNIRVVSADRYTIAGTVTEGEGETPVAGAAVQVLNSSSEVVATATTDADGTYTTTSVASGTYSLKVTASGYAAETKGNVTVAYENLTGQDFSLTADKTALIALYDANADRTQGSYTDASWEAFQTALTAAETVKDKDGATKAEIDQAIADLTAARNGLRTPPSASSGSSASTTTTTVTTADDGSKVTTVTTPDGTVTATVEQPDGTTSESVTTPEGDKTITVTDPDGEELVKVELPAEIPEPETTFIDIAQTPWAEKAINNVAALNLVNGIGGNKYDPATPMTRGSLATVLHRLSQGKTDYAVAFTDVAEGKYYTEGVAWAAKAKVVNGYTAEIFAPDDIITREQLAVMMARYAKLIGLDTKADAAALDKFVDGENTGAWAVDGVAWCVANGILKGKGQNNLDPTANVSRAEVAVMLDRFIALLK